jgi:hypothetical protein
MRNPQTGVQVDIEKCPQHSLASGEQEHDDSQQDEPAER